MKPVLVESSSLRTVVYDARRELLQVEFRDRSKYQYFGVPAAIYQSFLDAQSKGMYFNHAIRCRFPTVRVEA